MSLVLRNIDLNLDSIVYNEPKPSGHGGQTIYVNYTKDGQLHKACQIQTPFLYNPFGLNSSPPQEGEEPKYYVELSFGNAPSAYVEEFHNKMKGLDQNIIDNGIKNQRTWLGKTDVDQEYVDQFYKPIVRVYRNKEKIATGEFPNTIRFKIPYYNNTGAAGEDGEVAHAAGVNFSDMEVYDANRNLIPITSIDELREALGKGNRVRVISQLHSVWQSGNEFGASWRVKRIQVLASENSSSTGDNCAFGNDDDGELPLNTNAPAFDQNNSDEE